MMMRQEQKGSELPLSRQSSKGDLHSARWWQALTDLDRVLTTAQALHLLLSQHGEVLVRVGIELAIDQQAQQIVDWGRDWYVDSKRREWFRQVVHSKTQQVLDKGKASGAPLQKKDAANPEPTPEPCVPEQQADPDQAFRTVLERHKERVEDLKSKYEQAKRQIDEGEAQALKLNDRDRSDARKLDAVDEMPNSLRLKASASSPVFYRQEPGRVPGWEYRGSQKNSELSLDQPSAQGVHSQMPSRSVTADMHTPQARPLPSAQGVHSQMPPRSVTADMHTPQARSPPRSVTADNRSSTTQMRTRSDARDQGLHKNSPHPWSVPVEKVEKVRAQRRSGQSAAASHADNENDLLSWKPNPSSMVVAPAQGSLRARSPVYERKQQMAATAPTGGSRQSPTAPTTDKESSGQYKEVVNLSAITDSVNSESSSRRQRSSSMATPAQASLRARSPKVERQQQMATTAPSGGWQAGIAQRKGDGRGDCPTLLPDLGGISFVNRLTKPPSAASSVCSKGHEPIQAHGNLFAYRLGSE